MGEEPRCIQAFTVANTKASRGDDRQKGEDWRREMKRYAASVHHLQRHATYNAICDYSVQFSTVNPRYSCNHHHHHPFLRLPPTPP